MVSKRCRVSILRLRAAICQRNANTKVRTNATALPTRRNGPLLWSQSSYTSHCRQIAIKKTPIPHTTANIQGAVTEGIWDERGGSVLDFIRRRVHPLTANA